jgi:hypothetical protein
MSPLTQQQINQYQWQVADGVARIVNPHTPIRFDYNGPTTPSEYILFEEYAKEYSYHTNAPDGIYSGEALEIGWWKQSIENEDDGCFSLSNAGLMGYDYMPYLKLKPSQLPAVLTTQPGEEWKDRYKEVWEVLSWSREWQQDTDNTYNNYEEFKSYYKQLNWPTRQTWHLNTPPTIKITFN